MRNDPAPDRDMPIGVGIMEHCTGIAEHLEVDPEAGEQRQRDAETAAAGGRDRDFGHAAICPPFAARIKKAPAAAAMLIPSLTTPWPAYGRTDTHARTLAMPLHLDLFPLAGFAGLMTAAGVEDCRRLVIPN